ncbi:MAG: efflux RND transporter periplasmic adaptor subunit [Paracoccaceae bacterium]|nr:efflux RND transporter periplasmic adaptor subunit [Paracoccaceae bacterium]
MPEKNARRKHPFLRRAGTAATTVLTLALASGLVAGASALVAERSAPEQTEREQAVVAVLTETIRLQDSYEVAVAYRGRVEAGQRVDIGFEAGGTLVSVLVDEGDRVRKGEVIARLDTRALEADRAAQVAARDALAAQTELARRTAERQRALAERDHASAQRLDEAELSLVQLEAELRRAGAAIDALDIALEKSTLKAPFDAIVGRRAADDGARLSAGQSVVELYETALPRLRVGVPEAVAAEMTPGQTAIVEIGGETVEASLLRVRADIDPSTRTRDLLFALPDGTTSPDGTLATLSLTRTVPGTGAWVPTAALGEGVRGLWTLFVIENGLARREAVEVVHTAGARAYVRGHLADGATVVSAGPHRIAAGQPVTPAGS